MSLHLVAGIGPGLIFGSAVVACGALRPGYSHLHQLMSELGATNSPNAMLMNAAGFVAPGLLLVLFAVILAKRFTLSRSFWSISGCLLIGLFGAGLALAGVFPCDAGCPASWDSVGQARHNAASVVTFGAAIWAPAVWAPVLRREGSASGLPIFSATAAGLAAVFATLMVLAPESRQFVGLWQRLFLGVVLVWCGVFSAALNNRLNSGAAFCKDDPVESASL